MAAITYDSVALLRHFAAGKGITYPLLADPDSKVIRAFDILNENFPPGHAWYGVPFPGTYIIDERGIVRAKYFEEDHRERYTASSVLIRLGEQAGAATMEVETKHLKLVASASDPVIRGGNRVRLMLDFELKPGMHVYSPGVQGGYIPIEWQMSESKRWLAHTPEYPTAKTLHLPAIRETVPVYKGRFRLARDLTVGQSQEIRPLLSGPKGLTVEGSLRYQACDDKVCYPPQTIPLKWTFQVGQHDSQRAPEELQKRRASSN